jgi:hypothetical protein
LSCVSVLAGSYALMVVDRIYVGPSTAALVGWLMDKAKATVDYIKKKIKMRKSMTLEAELQAEEANRLKNKQREVELAVEGGETVEPILDAFSGCVGLVLSLAPPHDSPCCPCVYNALASLILLYVCVLFCVRMGAGTLRT